MSQSPGTVFERASLSQEVSVKQARRSLDTTPLPRDPIEGGLEGGTFVYRPTKTETGTQATGANSFRSERTNASRTAATIDPDSTVFYQKHIFDFFNSNVQTVEPYDDPESPKATYLARRAIWSRMGKWDRQRWNRKDETESRGPDPLTFGQRITYGWASFRLSAYSKLSYFTLIPTFGYVDPLKGYRRANRGVNRTLWPPTFRLPG